MTVIEILFYLFSAVLVAAAGMVITVRNPVYAALFLVLTFFSAAALWMLLEAEFLAIVLVLVYVGAVMVLFLFVVMMLDVNLTPLKEGFTRYLPVGLLVALAMLAELMIALWSRGKLGVDAFPVPAPNPQDYNNTKAVGEWLFSKYLWPFEIAGIVLLVAIIAAISLTLRKRSETKYQNPARQVRVQRKDRIRLVDMAAEDEQ